MDKCRRFAIECNHSSTHLLHKALRNVLGTHVEQKGSSVDDQRLRFDFSHFAKMTKDEIREVERLVNIDIRRNIALEEHRAMPIAEAQKLGAMALFGEKYGEFVRVVKYAESIEFCGGTHVSATGNIGSFKIVSESAVAAGMRRIEAVTAQAAEMLANEREDQIEALKEMFKSTKDLVGSVQKVLDDNAALKSQIEKFQQQQANAMRKEFESKVAASPIVVERMDSDLGLIRDAMLQLAKDHPEAALVLGSSFGDKPALMVVLGKNHIDAGKNAGNIVRTAGKEIQGGGGGQPAIATAGGKNLEGLAKAMEVAKSMIE